MEFNVPRSVKRKRAPLCAPPPAFGAKQAENSAPEGGPSNNSARNNDAALAEPAGNNSVVAAGNNGAVHNFSVNNVPQSSSPFDVDGENLNAGQATKHVGENSNAAPINFAPKSSVVQSSNPVQHQTPVVQDVGTPNPGGNTAPKPKSGVLKFARAAERGAVCRNCGPRGVLVSDFSSGDLLCSECGLVCAEKILSEEQEWRSFSNDSGKSDDKNRAGGVIDTWFEDGRGGTTIQGGSRKLQQIHDTVCTISNSDKLLRNAFYNLKLITEAFCLSEQVVGRAKEITKELQQNNNLKSKTSMLYMLAVIYIASREAGIAKQVKELAVYDKSITDKDLGKAILRVKKMLPDRAPTVSETAGDLMPRFGSRLQLSMQLVEVAEYVTRMAGKFINKSHRPCSIAGAALYLVTQLSLVKTDIGDIANIAGASVATIKSVYKELLPLSHHLLPPHFKPTRKPGKMP